MVVDGHDGIDSRDLQQLAVQTGGERLSVKLLQVPERTRFAVWILSRAAILRAVEQVRLYENDAFGAVVLRRPCRQEVAHGARVAGQFAAAGGYDDHRLPFKTLSDMFVILQKDESRAKFGIRKILERKDIRNINLLSHAFRDITRQRIV